VDPRAGLDDVEKRKFLTLQGLELRRLGRPARSQSLYRLSYPGSRLYSDKTFKFIIKIVLTKVGCVSPKRDPVAHLRIVRMKMNLRIL
jgi:hypothetical protein